MLLTWGYIMRQVGALRIESVPIPTLHLPYLYPRYFTVAFESQSGVIERPMVEPRYLIERISSKAALEEMACWLSERLWLCRPLRSLRCLI
jgi:hypothetical protein